MKFVKGQTVSYRHTDNGLAMTEHATYIGPAGKGRHKIKVQKKGGQRTVVVKASEIGQPVQED